VIQRSVPFKMRDEAGRRIGALVDFKRVEGGWSVRVSPTKNGKVVRRGRWEPAANQEAALAAAQRRAETMLRRYAKKLNLLADGCHAKWRCRETGTTLTLRDAEDYETDPSAGRYFVICEDHGTCVGVETKRQGRSSSGVDFCDECREAARRSA